MLFHHCTGRIGFFCVCLCSGDGATVAYACHVPASGNSGCETESLSSALWRTPVVCV